MNKTKPKKISKEELLIAIEDYERQLKAIDREIFRLMFEIRKKKVEKK